MAIIDTTILHPKTLNLSDIRENIYCKIRVRDIVAGLSPQPYRSDISKFPAYIDINQYSLFNLLEIPDGRRAHLLHTWTGDEGELSLAEAVLPPETLWFYKKEMERLRSVFGDNHQKRDILMMDAIRQSIPDRLKDSNVSEES